MKHCGYHTTLANRSVISRSTKETLRIIDAKKKECEYAQEKFGINYDLVDA